MSKPRILVMTATGKTGLPTALQLLSEGYPVTAFVRKEDQRSERLKAKGADIVAGSILDLTDMRRALSGVQRAYYCTPFVPGNLTAASVFAIAAAEQGLESVVAMGQWLANPAHPSLHTREGWLTDRLLGQLPGIDLTLLNPGFFADNDMHSLPFAAQFGLMMVPYGSGLNAPPSNEDIAGVAAEILARPEGHAGKTYRPTGPRLISPQDIASTFGKVLGRKITYIDTPMWVMAKVMRGVGISDYQIAQYAHYVLDYQKNAFAVNAPTDVVRSITGRAPEDFEQITRRNAARMPDTRRSLGTLLRYMALMNVWMLRPGPANAAYLRNGDFSDAEHITLSADSPEWRRSHETPTKFEGTSASGTFSASAVMASLR